MSSALRLLLALFSIVGVIAPESMAQPRTALNVSDDPLLRGFHWRVIGPIGQGGRVDDIAVVERNPSIYYVGFATGGVWKTINNGTTFEPIFDRYGTHSVGDLAVAPSNPDVVYVGTGEPNNRQSSSFGDGIYKTTDAGRTFTNMGLRESQSIARIVVHPTNPDVVWVAAVGHLFGPNAERGVFKTTDGGRTWNRVLFVDENTGATEIVIHPRNPDVLFAAMYARRRTSCCFVSGGPTGGIFKSTDGGRNWSKVTGGGLPDAAPGRIGLDISRSNPDVMYAQIELGGAGRGGGGGGGGGAAPPPNPAASGVWRTSDGARTWQFVSNQNNRPMYYSQIRIDPNNENTVYVGGASAFKSIDGGRTWTQLTGFGHGDHHAMWINPANSDHVLYGNDGSVDVSYDAGGTWEALRTWVVGQPYHASVDMRRPYYVCTGLQDNGSWCGPSATRTGTILAQDWYRTGGGDGFHSQIDPTDHTILYTESQNGNVNRLDLRAGTSVSIRPRGTGGGRGGGGGPSNVVPAPDSSVQFRFNWQTPILLSPHNPSTVYVAGERLFTSKDRGRTWSMSADLTKQIDRDQREIMGLKVSLPPCAAPSTGSCIHSRNDGTSFYSTIATISESPKTAGVIWVGTDDGNVQVSRDAGATWTEVGANIPGGTKEYYVSRVEASHFDAGTAYVSLDGHRSDDLRPYIYVTRDYGRSWTSIASDLPAVGNVNTVKEDPVNPSLLYAGTEFGFFVSLDGGNAWKRFMTNLPVVRIDDVVIHPRDNDLVLSTHGRSVWIMDDISALQQMNASTLAADAVLFQPREAVLWKNDIRQSRSVTGSKQFRSENAPDGTSINYYLKNVPSGDVRITIKDLKTGEVFRTMAGTKVAGLNRLQWNLCSDPRPGPAGAGGAGSGGGGGGGGGAGGGCGGGGGGPPAAAAGVEPPAPGAPPVGGPRRLATPGSYSVTLTVDGRDHTKNVEVLEDIWMQ